MLIVNLLRPGITGQRCQRSQIVVQNTVEGFVVERSFCGCSRDGLGGTANSIGGTCAVDVVGSAGDVTSVKVAGA